MLRLDGELNRGCFFSRAGKREEENDDEEGIDEVVKGENGGDEGVACKGVDVNGENGGDDGEVKNVDDCADDNANSKDDTNADEEEE